MKSNLFSAPGYTTLEALLSDEPWQNYKLGVGIDVLTGDLRRQAVTDIDLSPAGPLELELSFHLISSSEDYAKYVSSQFAGAYNSVKKLETETDFERQIAFSETSLSIVARCRVRRMAYPLYDGAQSGRTLTEEARKFVQEPEAFRARFGDYFVDNYLSGSEMTLVYRCVSRDTVAMSAFRSKVSAGTSFFTVKGATELTTNAKDNQTTVSVQGFYTGVRTVPPLVAKAEDVPIVLQWFLEKGPDGTPANLEFTPMRAKLVHYKQLAIDSGIETIVKVPADIFARIGALREGLYECSAILGKLPVYYGNQMFDDKYTYAEYFRKLTVDFLSEIGKFIENPALLTNMEAAVEQVREYLKKAMRVYSFYLSVADGIGEDLKHKRYVAQAGVTGQAGCPVLLKSAYFSVDTRQWQKVSFPQDFQDKKRGDVAQKGDIIVGFSASHSKPLKLRGIQEPSEYIEHSPAVGLTSAEFSLRTAQHELRYGLAATVKLFWVERTQFPWLPPYDEQTSGAAAGQNVV